MTITAVTFTNPGAETGDTTGWTQASGTGVFSAQASSPHSGTYRFQTSFSPGQTSTNIYQQIAVDPTWEASIDANEAAIDFTCWMLTSGLVATRPYLEFRSSGGTVISTETFTAAGAGSWTEKQIFVEVPTGTRFFRFGHVDALTNSASTANVYWDDFAADFSSDRYADYPSVFDPHVSQLGVYALGQFPSAQARSTQMGIIALGAAEESTGFHDLSAHQLGIYVLCRPNADRRELRAWTFKQDDHEFYGVQLGAGGTIVWDKLTGQWCTWKSPGFAYWRAEDVCDWEGFNLAGDTESGKIFHIDPTGRLDYGDTPITSRVVGYLTHRFRKEVPCFMAELALSEGEPPAGFDEGEVGITLRTSNDNGQSFINHGEIPGGGIAEDLTARWWGLGLMKSPGMLFEITDTGYARRIDGLDIETNEDG